MSTAVKSGKYQSRRFHVGAMVAFRFVRALLMLDVSRHSDLDGIGDVQPNIGRRYTA